MFSQFSSQAQDIFREKHQNAVESKNLPTGESPNPNTPGHKARRPPGQPPPAGLFFLTVTKVLGPVYP